jgi:hypothetical protein
LGNPVGIVKFIGVGLKKGRGVLWQLFNKRELEAIKKKMLIMTSFVFKK